MEESFILACDFEDFTSWLFLGCGEAQPCVGSHVIKQRSLFHGA